MERPVRPDPISAWLSGWNSSWTGLLLWMAAVWSGSVIPVMLWGPGHGDLFFGIVGNYFIACACWGWFCWLGWLAIPAYGVYFYRFMFEDTPKRDLFIGFSISYVVFAGGIRGILDWVLLLAIYGLIWVGVWGWPQRGKRQGKESHAPGNKTA